MRRPSVHQLEVFCKVVQLGSMARAAEAFRVSASSVSMQIQELERRYRTPLLVRSRRGTSPTSAGSALHRHAQALLDGLDAAEQEILAIGALQSGTLRFACARTIGTAVVRPALQAFEREYPEIDVAYHVMSSSQQATSEVLDGRAEFALVGRFDKGWPLDITPFFDEPLVVVMNPGHPLAAVEPLTATSLAEVALLLRESPVLGRDRVLAGLAEHGVVPHVIELGSTEAIKAEALAGNGITVLPYTVVEDAVEAGELVLRSVDGLNPNRTVYLAVLPKTPLSPAADAFIRLMRERYEAPPRSASAGSPRPAA